MESISEVKQAASELADRGCSVKVAFTRILPINLEASGLSIASGTDSDKRRGTIGATLACADNLQTIYARKNDVPRGSIVTLARSTYHQAGGQRHCIRPNLLR